MTPPELTELDERELLEDDLTLEGTDELEIIELDDELETGQDAPPTTPNGEGWLLQVEAAIQLLLFS